MKRAIWKMNYEPPGLPAACRYETRLACPTLDLGSAGVRPARKNYFLSGINCVVIFHSGGGALRSFMDGAVSISYRIFLLVRAFLCENGLLRHFSQKFRIIPLLFFLHRTTFLIFRPFRPSKVRMLVYEFF